MKLFLNAQKPKKPTSVMIQEREIPRAFRLNQQVCDQSFSRTSTALSKLEACILRMQFSHLNLFYWFSAHYIKHYIFCYRSLYFFPELLNIEAEKRQIKQQEAKEYEGNLNCK